MAVYLCFPFWKARTDSALECFLRGLSLTVSMPFILYEQYNTYYTEQAEAQGETQEAARDDSFYNPKARPWINEFHYNNIGEDVNEFIEVAVPLTVDLNASNFVVVLYDGFYSRLYKSDAFHPLSTFKQGNTTGGVTFYNKRFPRANCSEASTWCGLQNGYVQMMGLLHVDCYMWIRGLCDYILDL